MATKSDFTFRYRVRNWSQYNRALIERGSLTFWVDEHAVQSWCDQGASSSRGGRPRIYADAAIESALVLKAVFHLSLRGAQGFLESVVRLMGVDLPAPNYTTVCRRQVDLELELNAKSPAAPRHVVIDTTGLKVFGAGEWTLRKHGVGSGRRRTWRKLHLGVDEATKEIVAVDLTASAVHDSVHLPAVLGLVAGEIGQVSGDRAYDTWSSYEAILERGATPTIPPRRTARFSTMPDPPPPRLARDAVLRSIKAYGRYRWRSSSGATRQSLAENAVPRFKALVGVKLSARGPGAATSRSVGEDSRLEPDGGPRHAEVGSGPGLVILRLR